MTLLRDLCLSFLAPCPPRESPADGGGPNHPVPPNLHVHVHERETIAEAIYSSSRATVTSISEQILAQPRPDESGKHRNATASTVARCAFAKAVSGVGNGIPNAVSTPAPPHARRACSPTMHAISSRNSSSGVLGTMMMIRQTPRGRMTRHGCHRQLRVSAIDGQF